MKFPLILDGATGTMLQKAGMPAGVCPELWLLEHPEAAKFQQDYVEAGCQVLYAPTFGANRVKLARFGAAHRVAEVNRALVELSRSMAGGKALVAGDLSPTGKFLPPMGDTSFDELVDIYREQAAALEEAGVDLFVAETLMSMADARAALLAARSVSAKPFFCTFTVDENGRTLTGTSALAALLTMQAMGADGFGLNCSAGPETMARHLAYLAPYARIPLIAKPNAGLPVTVNGATEYDLSPEAFASCVPVLESSGVSVFGGCCGTTPEHMAALSAAVGKLESRSVPVRPLPKAVTTGRDAFFYENTESCIPLSCSDDLEDDLLDAGEEEVDFLAIRIEDKEDARCFARCAYAAAKPLILDCDDPEALEIALGAWQGLALCRTALPEEVVAPLARRYGAVFLR